MIIQALQVMLFGMLGIFLVMGVVITAATMLSLATAGKEGQDRCI